MAPNTRFRDQTPNTTETDSSRTHEEAPPAALEVAGAEDEAVVDPTVVVAALRDAMLDYQRLLCEKIQSTPDTHEEAEETADDWLAAAPPPMQALLDDERMVIGDE